MGFSYVEFRGREFEAKDAALEVWLALVVDEIDKLADMPDWLKTARDEWDLSATERFNFGVVPNLDEHIKSEEQRRLLSDLCALAMARLRSFRDPIPAAILNGIRPFLPGEGYDGVVRSDVFLRPAENFIRLLDGDPLLAPAEA